MAESVPIAGSRPHRWVAWVGLAIAAASLPTLNMHLQWADHPGGYAGYVVVYPGQAVLIVGVVVIFVGLLLADRPRRRGPTGNPSEGG